MRLALDDIKISIHALLAESDLSSNVWSVLLGQISIHALLAESDIVSGLHSSTIFISIHALLAESDLASKIDS